MDASTKNVDVSFTNVQGKSNFKKKNEEDLINLIEPETSLGFVSMDRGNDISDLLYVRDAINNENCLEEILRAQEEEEIARFRLSSAYRPSNSSSQQAAIINVSKRDKDNYVSPVSKIMLKVTKKRKTPDEMESGTKKDETLLGATAVANKVSDTDVRKTELISVAAPKSPINTLSGLMGAYDDDGSD